MDVGIGLAILAVFAFLLFEIICTKQRNLPPGPPKLPVIGSIIHVVIADSAKPYAAFMKLSKKYGDIISLRLGSLNVVAFQGYQAVKDLEEDEEFVDRIQDKWVVGKSYGLPYGLLFSEGRYWAETRKFSQKLLREIVLGQTDFLESHTTAIFSKFVNQLEESMSRTSGIVTIDTQFYLMFLNLAWTFVTSENFQDGDESLQKLGKVCSDFILSGRTAGGLTGLYPWLIDVFPKWSGFTEQMKLNREFEMFMEVAIAEIKLKQNYKTNPTSFVERFLKMIEENETKIELLSQERNVSDYIFSEKNLVGLLQDLVLGGTDTQAHTLNFGVRYLVQFPKVQMRVQSEVDEVLGGKQVSVNDLPRLIYTRATMYEIFRITTVAPTLGRQTFAAKKFQGYDIPRGTLLVPNYFSANMDERVWELPENFNPDRFISSDGNIVDVHKIMTFGAGKRNCIGKSIANISTVLILASLMQKYNFDIDPATGPLGNETIEGFSRNTVPYKVKISTRNTM